MFQASHNPPNLPNLLVLFLRLDHDWQILVGVFPQREEILVRFARFRQITLNHSRLRQPEMRRNIHDRLRRPAPVIEYFLKFGSGLCAFLFAQVYVPAQVVLPEKTCALVAARGLKDLKRLSAVSTLDFDGGLRHRYAPFNDWFSGILLEHFIHQGLRLPDFATRGM